MARSALSTVTAGKYGLSSANALCLPPATGKLPPVGGIQVASPAAPVPKNLEHAGHAYHDLVLVSLGLETSSSCNGDSTAPSKLTNTSDDDLRADEYLNDKQMHLKKAALKDSEDLYDLLELGNKRWRATADDIKKSFRRISLIYHPDKVTHLGEEALQNSETHFKKVRKAYDILSDKRQRASYDSIDDVDDSIPSESSISDSNFYVKLRPVFDLNARWSISDRVPSLGDEKTPLSQVNKFYDFWYSFKTWRDFSFDLEYDLDQAECREEKRWMERQNQKHVKARKLEEASRIRRLVDTAYKNDPRIRLAKDEVRKQKEAVKLQRRKEREEAEKAEKDRLALEKAEEERKLEVERQERDRAKREKDIQRQANRKARQRFRSLAKELNLMDSDDKLITVERCCCELSASKLDSLSSRLGSASSSDVNTLLLVLTDELGTSSNVNGTPNSSGKDRYHENNVTAPDSQCCSHASQSNCAESVLKENSNTCVDDSQSPHSDAEWSADEIKRLTKALSKYPPGTRDRNEKLASFVSTRDVSSVLAMVNAMRVKKGSRGTVQNPSSRPSAVVPRSDFEKFQMDKKKCVIVPPPTYTYESSSTSLPNQSAPKAPESLESKQNSEVSRDPVSNKPPNKIGFTTKQQVQLESAMKKYPPSLGSSRWERIALEVTDRSSLECETRFKELVSYYRAKKAVSAK